MANVGLFGKLPTVGDFVSRGLSPALCERLDQLLQAALVAATRDGADARQVMAQAAPLMVSIRPGALCGTGFTGVWIPSRDRVGRVFPLCVGRETSQDQSQVPLLWPSPALTRLLCTAVVKALQVQAGPDELIAALPAGAQWDAAAVEGIPFSDMGDETVPAVSSESRLFAIAGPEPGMPLGNRALCSRLPWIVQMLGTRVAPDGSAERYFASRAIEAAEHYAALFDGRWTQWQWDCYEVAGPAASGQSS